MTFVRELAEALHADGRTLTVSIPPVYDPAVAGGSGYWVYAPGTIAEYVDAIRIMAYDYSVAEPGPIAPLAWVAQAVDGVSKAVPEQYHDKLVLGVPAYGANWVTATTGTCPADAEGKTTVNTRNVLDLSAKREGDTRLRPDDRRVVVHLRPDGRRRDARRACSHARCTGSMSKEQRPEQRSQDEPAGEE